MKAEVEKTINEHGTDNPPPPAQLFTIPHVPGQGNVHMVQKIFTGPFEVCNLSCENTERTAWLILLV